MAADRSCRITAAMCAHGRVLGEPRLSPDGDRVAFVATAMGRGQIVVVAASGGSELVITAAPPPRAAMSYGGGAFDWVPGGEAIVYAAVDGGLWHVDASGGPARCITDPGPAGPAGAPAVAPDGSAVAYLLDNHHVAVASLDPGGPWPVRLSTTADFCFDPSWSADSSTVVWHEWDVPAMPWDASSIVARDRHAAEPPRHIAGGAGVSVAQPRFSPAGDRLAYLCDERGWLNVWVAGADGSGAAALIAEACEHGDPSWGPGQRSFAWSADGARIALARNDLGFGELAVVDVASGVCSTVAKGVHGGLSWVGDKLAAVRSGARTPTQVVCMDMASGSEAAPARITLARGPVGGFELVDLAEPEAVTWPGEDGGAVHGRLYRGRVGDAAPPMLVWIHGGPTGQWGVTFIPRLTFFLDRGWNVLAPDHRGSTGYGRAYTQAMVGRWGELDVSDVAAGMRAAGERGWADPRRMVPIGGSAGGFTVLNLLAHHPDLCAAGVDLFGVTDLLDLDETTHRFEAHYLQSIVGELPGAIDRYRERSPITVADKIRSPLLVLQGSADVVVPPAQSRSMAERVRAAGGHVELHEYEGEGHGWNRPEVVVDELERIEDFLRRHVMKWRT